MKKRDCSFCAVKTKALISCAVTAQLICVFVFAYAFLGVSYAAAHITHYSNSGNKAYFVIFGTPFATYNARKKLAHTIY